MLSHRIGNIASNYTLITLTTADVLSCHSEASKVELVGFSSGYDMNYMVSS